MKELEPGDLVEMFFDKRTMKFDRYRQPDFLEGVAVVISGPHKGPGNSVTYELRFQNRHRVARVPASMIRLLSSRN